MRKDLAGGFHDSGFTSFGRVILPQLGVKVNKNMIRNLSFTLGDIAESVAKTIAAQKRALDSLVKVDNRTVLDYLLLSKEVSVLWPTPPAAPGLTLLGKLKLSYIRSLSNPLGLKSKLTSQPGIS